MGTKKKPVGICYIRWSDPSQAQGDSERRQMEIARNYCEQNGIELNESLSLTDSGKSGYHGTNKLKGNLALFLQWVKQGKVPKGAVLILESWDRLTRQSFLDSMDTLIQIINNDSEISIVIPELSGSAKIYNRSTYKSEPLLFLNTFMDMYRGNQESEVKSRRIRAAWSNKRERGKDQILTACAPLWLRIEGRTHDGKHAIGGKFKPIPERVRVVKLIFQLASQGLGELPIVRELNKRGIKPFGRADAWTISSVRKILNNPAVIGEYHPHTLKDGKRVPLGPGSVIEGYYPPIIDPALYQRVFKRRDLYRIPNGGRSSVDLGRNLFSTFMKCADCKGTVEFMIKDLAKDEVYLICRNLRRGLKCSSVPVRYGFVETNLLIALQDKIRLQDLEVSTDDAPNNAHEEIESLEAQLEILNRRIRGWEDALAEYQGANPKAYRQNLTGRIDESLIQIQTAEMKLAELRPEFERQTFVKANQGQYLKEVKDLIAHIRDSSNPEAQRELRLRLRSSLMTIIDRIEMKVEPMKVDEAPKTDPKTGIAWGPAKGVHRIITCRIFFRSGTMRMFVFVKAPKGKSLAGAYPTFNFDFPGDVFDMDTIKARFAESMKIQWKQARR